MTNQRQILGLAIVGIITGGLAGCAPTLAGGNAAGGIVGNVMLTNNTEAFQRAEQACQNYGKVAKVIGTDAWQRSMRYECVEK